MFGGAFLGKSTHMSPACEKARFVRSLLGSSQSIQKEESGSRVGALPRIHFTHLLQFLYARPSRELPGPRLQQRCLGAAFLTFLQRGLFLGLCTQEQVRESVGVLDGYPVVDRRGTWTPHRRPLGVMNRKHLLGA